VPGSRGTIWYGSGMSTIVQAIPTPSAGTKARAVALLAVCQVLAMSLWFAASAVGPQLRALYHLTGLHQAALASAVALGFVAGTLASAAMGLPDRMDPRRLFCVACVVAALANAAMVVVDPADWGAVALRLVVGASSAGIYPVGMKLASTWAKADMGLLVGILVGALTLGSATSFLVAAADTLDWRIPVLAASACALAASGLITRFQPGPRLLQAAAFRPAMAAQAFRAPALRLANLGYFGHMWELYAMWAWIGVFLDASIRAQGGDPGLTAKLATAGVIGAGALGSLAGGVLADRWGRTTLTIAAMLASGACALAVGLLFGGTLWLLLPLCLVWGITIVADSAQFSASVIELADPHLVGTMVTVQTCFGFLLTIVSIHLIPEVVDVVGWRYGFAMLAIGPFLGALAMFRLRSRPEAAKLAGGRR
jgi:MFS family permease